MSFFKSFPHALPTGRTEWIEVALTDAEEAKVETDTRQEHIRVMQECLRDAKEILKEEDLKDYQTNMVRLAASLFDKRASHVVWHKEEEARKKFERMKPT